MVLVGTIEIQLAVLALERENPKSLPLANQAAAQSIHGRER